MSASFATECKCAWLTSPRFCWDGLALGASIYFVQTDIRFTLCARRAAARADRTAVQFVVRS